ncbi:uncharacterized protein [Dysidea avara]|uniref:uncharacterized protein n=1 Tax=Dysidea avara TaxID=196820 RepID=UPI00333000C8
MFRVLRRVAKWLPCFPVKRKRSKKKKKKARIEEVDDTSTASIASASSKAARSAVQESNEVERETVVEVEIMSTVECNVNSQNEEFYNDIETSVQIHAEEILNERNEILQRLEEIKGAEQQCSTSMGEDSSPAIVSMECHSDSTPITSLTSSSLTKVTDIDFDNDNQVCVTDTKRRDVVSW